VTALYALRLSGEGDFDERIGTVSLRWDDPESRRSTELARDIRLGDLASTFERTAPTFQLAAIVAATAERFRGSPWGEAYDLRDVHEVAGRVADDLPRTDEVHEFLEILENAARLED
jgi:hypothetical protein